MITLAEECLYKIERGPIYDAHSPESSRSVGAKHYKPRKAYFDEHGIQTTRVALAKRYGVSPKTIENTFKRFDLCHIKANEYLLNSKKVRM